MELSTIPTVWIILSFAHLRFALSRTIQSTKRSTDREVIPPHQGILAITYNFSRTVGDRKRPRRTIHRRRRITNVDHERNIFYIKGGVYDHLNLYAVLRLPQAHALILDPFFSKLRSASPVDPNEAIKMPSRLY